MTHPAAEPLAAARALVEGAKGGPLGSGLKLNRDELLGLIDRATAALSEPTPQPSAPTDAEEDPALVDARAEADRVLAEARERADALVADSEVVRAARDEARALKLESDTWVDNHLAEFETGLNRTLELIETLRDRLASRSRDADAAAGDGGEPEATAD